MSRTFRPWKIDEPLLLPTTVADFVDESHLGRFVLSVVQEEIDLCKITGRWYRETLDPFGSAPMGWVEPGGGMSFRPARFSVIM
jgi:hypothetical protein